jgi:hypothetical protein
VRVAVVAPGDLALPNVQGPHSVAGILVAEVIYGTAEGVDGVEVLAGVPGEEPGAHGEVLVVGPGEGLAAGGRDSYW